MNEKGFIKNIVIIVVILVFIFLSQQTYFRGIGKNIFNQAESQIDLYWAKAGDWVKTNIYLRVSGEAQKRGEAIKEELNKEKNAVAQNIWEKIKNYFANIFSKSTGTQVQ